MNGLAQEKGKGRKGRTPALNYASKSLHQLPSKLTFAYRRPHNMPQGGDNTRIASAAAHSGGQVSCVNSCWQLDVVFQLGFRSYHHFTGAEPCTPLKLVTSRSPCLLSPRHNVHLKGRCRMWEIFQISKRRKVTLFFFSRKQSSFTGKNKSECLVQKQFLTNTLQVQKIMTKAGNNHSVTAALPAPSRPPVLTTYIHVMKSPQQAINDA